MILVIAGLAFILGMPLAFLAIACWAIAKNDIAREQYGAMD